MNNYCNKQFAHLYSSLIFSVVYSGAVTTSTFRTSTLMDMCNNRDHSYPHYRLLHTATDPFSPAIPSTVLCVSACVCMCSQVHGQNGLRDRCAEGVLEPSKIELSQLLTRDRNEKSRRLRFLTGLA